MLKPHQPALNVMQQIENLKNINLVIEDESSATEFLNNVSYFRLIKAFGLGLKEKNSSFNNGATFNLIKGLYIFNSRLRHILFPEIEKVEINLRCRIANHFSCKYGVLGYKDENNFEKPQHHGKFMADITAEIFRNKKSPFVRNFENNYEGGELPFYALIELFSFGMLSKFFKNMKSEDKKEIASFYGISYKYLESWFEHLSHVRNICAHYGRLYNVSLKTKPILFKQYSEKCIKNDKLFASLICLKHLLPSNKHWAKFVASIGLLLKEFPCVDKTLMGFPEKDWELYLMQPLKDIHSI